MIGKKKTDVSHETIKDNVKPKKKRKLFPRKEKIKSNKKEEPVDLVDENSIVDGKGSDNDPRTIRSKRWERYARFATIVTFIGIGSTFYGYREYHKYTVSNSTPFGQPLIFSNSGAKLILKGVYTDKNKEVTVVELGYDSTAHSKLSYKGTNYGINIQVASKSDIPKGMETRYGLLDTEGNGYLIIKGKLKPEAYQIAIVNRFTFSLDDQTEGFTKKQKNIEEQALSRTLSEHKMDDANKFGIIDFSKSTKKVGLDYFNFRVNPYSDNTINYKVSFLDKNGNIDYNKMMQYVGVKGIEKDLKTQKKSSEAKIKSYENAISELTDRLLSNPNDTASADNLKTAQMNLKAEKEVLSGLKTNLDYLKQAKFSEKSFGEINKEYKLYVK